MPGTDGGREVRFRPPSAICKAAQILTMLSTPSAFACAGATLVPVFLPGEQIDCLFEVVGEVTVQGPFRGPTDGDRTPREVVLEGVRLEVGQEAAGSGADGVMVRELLYDRDSAAAGDGPPELVAVEGMLISFVDPACAPGG